MARERLRETAGTLAERVVIERRESGRDAAADTIDTWTVVDTVFASVEPDGGLAALRLGEAARSGRRWRVVLRRRGDIDLAARLRWADHDLTIIAIEQAGRRQDHMVLLCESRAA